MNAPTIILVNPQMGENIGAAARAMFNFNLRDLRLVAPRDGWPNIEAERNAAGALEHLQLSVFETLEEAIADLGFVLATTARPRDMVKDVYTPPAAVEAFAKRAPTPCGFVFGAERTGLLNDHLALCHGIITIPTNPDFSSLNLGQSVLLMAWEWMRAQDNSAPIQHHNESNRPVPQEQMEEFFKRLESELEDGGFFKAQDLKPVMQRNIRNMVLRAELSDQELRTFHGIISALIGKKKPQS
jgi:tRNA/rRNA methyltransferase